MTATNRENARRALQSRAANIPKGVGMACLEISDKMKGSDIITLRGQYGLSQEQFAGKFGIPVEKLKEMELRA